MTGEQELLALHRALQVWRCYLEGSHEAELLTDHNPLIYLQTQPMLSRRQARWMEFFQRFPFVIHYNPGAKNNVADAISRNPALGAYADAMCSVVLCVTTRSKAARAPPSQQGGEERGGQQQRREPPLRQRRYALGLEQSNAQLASDLAAEILAGYALDERFDDPAFIEHLRLDESGFWLLDGKVVVPGDPRTKARVLAAYHDSPMCGHGGVAKTLELLSRDLWWPSLRADVAEYVRRCEACQRNKASTQRGAGLLQPLEVPERRWQSVSVDLVVKLPTTARGNDSVVVFVDRLSKMAHLVATAESLTAQQFADLTFTHVVRLHGVPEEMVSDRGPQFNNQFWGSVCELLGIKRSMSSAYHPQSDGQTERTIRTITEMLRSYVRPDQTDWDRWLPWAEFAYSNA